MAAPYSRPAVATALTTATALTAASARPFSADPWDSPYFGARIYFSYQPGLAGLEGQSARTSVTRTSAVPASLRPFATDPWDAPYFGARTYFSYQPALVGREAQPEMAAAAAAHPGASAPVAQVEAIAVTQRRGWLARLLGRD